MRLDVKNINIEIPQDVHFQNEEQILEVDTVKYARKATEIDRVFMAYIATKGHLFESKGRADKIASYLLEILADFFGIFDTDAKKVVLYHLNKSKFDRIIDTALEKYARQRDRAKKASAAKEYSRNTIGRCLKNVLMTMTPIILRKAGIMHLCRLSSSTMRRIRKGTSSPIWSRTKSI